eukprot:4274495-Pyramimonas_sp.AAC.1
MNGEREGLAVQLPGVVKGLLQDVSRGALDELHRSNNLMESRSLKLMPHVRRSDCRNMFSHVPNTMLSRIGRTNDARLRRSSGVRTYFAGESNSELRAPTLPGARWPNEG